MAQGAAPDLTSQLMAAASASQTGRPEGGEGGGGSGGNGGGGGGGGGGAPASASDSARRPSSRRLGPTPLDPAKLQFDVANYASLIAGGVAAQPTPALGPRSAMRAPGARSAAGSSGSAPPAFVSRTEP